MADEKLTQLSAATSIADNDLLYVVVNPGSSPTSEKITLANLQASLTTFVENEIVSGSGTSWTLADTPITGSVKIWAAGVRLYPGSDPNFGYSISGTAITTRRSYSTGDLIADYRK